MSRTNLRREPFLRREVGEIGRFFTFSSGPCEPVVLRFAPHVRAKVEDFFASGEMRVDDQGLVTVHLELPDDPWLFSFLLGFGADLEILSPPRWRERMAKIAQSMKNLYAT